MLGATGAQNASHGGVAGVNHQKHTVKLHMQSGKRLR